MGRSTPNLATKTILQGHHSDSPAEGTGAGSKGLKGSTWSPGPNAPHLQYSHHLATDVMKPVKSQGWVEPKWRGQLPFPPGFILLLLGSAGLSESI